MEEYLRILGKGDRVGLILIRLSIAIVLIWIGLLKFISHEADDTMPSAVNSLVVPSFYEHPEEYKQHLIHKGEFKPQVRGWQTADNMYTSSNGLGVVEALIVLLMLANLVSRWLGLISGALAFATPIVTLSFLIITPEAWVMPLGDSHHGFPYLLGAGRLVLKDTLMLAGAMMIIADSSRSIIKQQY